MGTSTGSGSNVELCAAYNGAYDCWRKAGHKGEHRHYRKSGNHTGYLSWNGPYDELIGHFINF